MNNLFLFGKRVIIAANGGPKFPGLTAPGMAWHAKQLPFLRSHAISLPFLASALTVIGIRLAIVKSAASDRAVVAFFAVFRIAFPPILELVRYLFSK